MHKYINLKTIIISALILALPKQAFAGISIISSNQGQRQFSYEIQSGKEQQGKLILNNLGEEEVTVNLYGADGTQSNQGTFALTTLNTPQKNIGKWVTFESVTHKLKAKEKREILFKIQVPPNTTPGIYSGGIAAESVNSTPETTAAAKSSNKSAISISSRVVIKLFVSIPGVKKNKMDWQNFTYSAGTEQSKPLFTLSYKNEGNIVIIADQKIEIEGYPALNKTINLPSATISQESKNDIVYKWTDEPFFGLYKAIATVTFSEYDIVNNKKLEGQTFKKVINIYIPLNLKRIEGKITVVVFLLIFGLLVLYLIKLFKYAKFRSSLRQYTVIKGDTIEKLAKKSNTDWKKLAKINKLKAPFELKAGKKIFIPPFKK